jgi:hypothetical protein
MSMRVHSGEMDARKKGKWLGRRIRIGWPRDGRQCTGYRRETGGWRNSSRMTMSSQERSMMEKERQLEEMGTGRWESWCQWDRGNRIGVGEGARQAMSK